MIQQTILRSADRCVICGAPIPEGRQVCPLCAGGVRAPTIPKGGETGMCNICHRRRCPAACPNAEDAAVGVCAACGMVIRASEREACITVAGRGYHRDCLADMELEALLIALDLPWQHGLPE